MSKEDVLYSSNLHPLPMCRIKAPPRYASRAVINDTYMRRICRDSVEKYKRTASEVYLANVNRISSKPSDSNQQSMNLGANFDSPSLTFATFPSLTDHCESQCRNRSSASSTSSSSSLELVVGLGVQPEATSSPVVVEDDTRILTKNNLILDVDEKEDYDEEPKQNSADVDSGLGGSDPIAVGLMMNETDKSSSCPMFSHTAALATPTTDEDDDIDERSANVCRDHFLMMCPSMMVDDEEDDLTNESADLNKTSMGVCNFDSNKDSSEFDDFYFLGGMCHILSYLSLFLYQEALI